MAIVRHHPPDAKPRRSIEDLHPGAVFRITLLLLLVPLVSWGVGGCTDRENPSPTAAPSPTGGDFYPLQVGNRWEYLSQISLRIVNDEGTVISNDLTLRRTRRLTGREEVFGREYVVEEVEIRDGNSVAFQRIDYRQDQEGLYVADLPFNVGPPDALPTLLSRGVPPAWQSALEELAARWNAVHAGVSGFPTGVEENEFLLLQYPLGLGTTWIVRDDDVRVTAEVVARETFDLPTGPTPGWTVRIDASVFGPDDRTELWYGRIGYIGLKSELNREVADASGNVLGTLHLIEVELLQEAVLDGEATAPTFLPMQKTRPW